MTTQISRRNFLKSASALAGGALVIGFDAGEAIAQSAGSADFTPFVRITTDGQVTAIIKHFECGQGTATGLSALIAEELNMPLNHVEVDFAPADASRYGNTLFGGIQGTGGSTAMADSYLKYRTAGAAAREILIGAAADQWGISASGVTLEDGVITSGSRSTTIGKLVPIASQRPVPASPALKDPSEFTVIGNSDTRRRDSGAKTNGTAIYGMDIHLDNQIVAMVLRCPRFGGTLVSHDDSGAQGLPGFIRTAAIPAQAGAGVIVYAENTWAALQARDAIAAEWDFSDADNRSSDQIKTDLLAAVNTDAEFDARGTADETAVALEGAAQVVERDFFFPFLGPWHDGTNDLRGRANRDWRHGL